MKVSEKVKSIKQRIDEAARRSGRQAEDVQIIAVTKYVTTARAEEAVEAGINHLGENRAEGLNEKYESIGQKAVWHFIGSLQTRKVKSMIHQADFIHSLDRMSLAKEINSRAEKPIQCFVQVNVSGEESKHGIAPEEVVPFVQSLHIYEKIRVCGLMTMAPLTEDQDLLRSCFRKLALCRDEVAALHLSYAPCRELSMGMSNDFEIAVEEGATMIRIGTALVGE
ncbi:YggS family pyridoxal phosphate-dependent enzyme [Domibacillus robiginosus]|uniref:YggS family pyridoxal phosphate-dependent enzyme n=1 Tax=Domibacillus robiginosus TaxID=1071054 RepID=UPI00067BBD4B|nr:YggS family pyridoxal phosphate-dependent enzyme [Domibacillus robiginosus]